MSLHGHVIAAPCQRTTTLCHVVYQVQGQTISSRGRCTKLEPSHLFPSRCSQHSHPSRQLFKNSFFHRGTCWPATSELEKVNIKPVPLALELPMEDYRQKFRKEKNLTCNKWRESDFNRTGSPSKKRRRYLKNKPTRSSRSPPARQTLHGGKKRCSYMITTCSKVTTCLWLSALHFC